MWTYIAQGIGFGFSAAIQPGPFQTFMLAHTLEKGWRRSLLIALAPLLSDAPIVILILIVLSQIPPTVERILYIASGLFILYLAWGVFRSLNKDREATKPKSKDGPQTRFKAALMNLISPGPYLFWSLVAGPAFLSGWRTAPSHGFGLLIGFYTTMILTLTGLIIVVGQARELGPKVNRILMGISGIALVCFGILQLWRGIT